MMDALAPPPPIDATAVEKEGAQNPPTVRDDRDP